MKIHGYCMKCHKVKRVEVKTPSTVGVQVGVCDDCSGKEKP